MPAQQLADVAPADRRRRRATSPPASGNSKSISRSRSCRPIWRSVMPAASGPSGVSCIGTSAGASSVGRGVDRPPHRCSRDWPPVRRRGRPRTGRPSRAPRAPACRTRARRQVGHRRRHVGARVGRRPARRRPARAVLVVELDHLGLAARPPPSVLGGRISAGVRRAAPGGVDRAVEVPDVELVGVGRAAATGTGRDDRLARSTGPPDRLPLPAAAPSRRRR